MKCLRLASVAVALAVFAGPASAQTIEDIVIAPFPPQPGTPFSVSVSGEESYVETSFDEPFFVYSRTGNNLMLDLRFLLPDGAISPATNPYSATYVAEPLPAGTYTLNVRSLLNGAPAGGGGVVTFTVVPEPAALAMGAAAAPLLLARRRQSPRLRATS